MKIETHTGNGVKIAEIIADDVIINNIKASKTSSEKAIKASKSTL